MESLSKRLFLYRSTQGRRAWEDWLTESFAAVLDRDPRLGVVYAGHLIGRDVESADIETQRTFKGARPDMWIRRSTSRIPCSASAGSGVQDRLDCAMTRRRLKGASGGHSRGPRPGP